MKKRILSITLALLLVFALLPFGAMAAADLKPYAEVLEPLAADVCGAYEDLDGDGTPELLLLVPEQASYAAEVYTISGGKAVRLLHESFSLGNEKLSLHHGERGEVFLQLSELNYIDAGRKDDYDQPLCHSSRRNRLFVVDGSELRLQSEAAAEVLQTYPASDGSIYYTEEESQYWIDELEVSAQNYYSRLYNFETRNPAFLTLTPDDPGEGERVERLLTIAKRGYIYVPEPNGVECYADKLQEVLDDTKNIVYGTFVDLDRDGTLELIIQRECGIQGHFFDIYTQKDGEVKHLLREQYSIFEKDEYTLLTQAPDGSLALMMHREGGGAPGFETEDGTYYYYSHITDDIYEMRDGRVERTGAIVAERLQTAFAEDGSYSYFPDESHCTVNGNAVSDDEYWAWFERYDNTHQTLMLIAPDVETEGCVPCEQLLAAAKGGFMDVPAAQYYAEPVFWAVEEYITNGTTRLTFSPEAPCTRGQVVTFLWRAAGSPEPEREDNPFADVSESDYFYKPVLWAVEQGITNGMDATHFGPDVACTRAHVVTFLWRAHEKPAAGTSNPFRDVPAGEYYTDAVLWAVKNEITNGTGDGMFSPDLTCTRGQIVTFLYRDLAK